MHVQVRESLCFHSLHLHGQNSDLLILLVGEDRRILPFSYRMLKSQEGIYSLVNLCFQRLVNTKSPCLFKMKIIRKDPEPVRSVFFRTDFKQRQGNTP